MSMKIEFVPKCQAEPINVFASANVDLMELAKKLHEIKSLVGDKGYVSYHVGEALKTTEVLINQGKQLSKPAGDTASSN